MIALILSTKILFYKAIGKHLIHEMKSLESIINQIEAHYICIGELLKELRQHGNGGYKMPKTVLSEEDKARIVANLRKSAYRKK